MKRADVTFETKCWEQDWEVLLTTPRLGQMIERNHFPFARRVLLINNMSDPAAVQRAAERAIQQGVLSEFHLVAEHADEALEFFQVNAASFGRGYVYSIAELVGIYLCR